MTKRPFWRMGTRKAIGQANEALAVQRAQAQELPLHILLDELRRRVNADDAEWDRQFAASQDLLLDLGEHALEKYGSPRHGPPFGYPPLADDDEPLPFEVG